MDIDNDRKRKREEGTTTTTAAAAAAPAVDQGNEDVDSLSSQDSRQANVEYVKNVLARYVASFGDGSSNASGNSDNEDREGPSSLSNDGSSETSSSEDGRGSPGNSNNPDSNSNGKPMSDVVAPKEEDKKGDVAIKPAQNIPSSNTINRVPKVTEESSISESMSSKTSFWNTRHTSATLPSPHTQTATNVTDSSTSSSTQKANGPVSRQGVQGVSTITNSSLSSSNTDGSTNDGTSSTTSSSNNSREGGTDTNNGASGGRMPRSKVRKTSTTASPSSGGGSSAPHHAHHRHHVPEGSSLEGKDDVGASQLKPQSRQQLKKKLSGGDTNSKTKGPSAAAKMQVARPSSRTEEDDEDGDDERNSSSNDESGSDDGKLQQQGMHVQSTADLKVKSDQASTRTIVPPTKSLLPSAHSESFQQSSESSRYPDTSASSNNDVSSSNNENEGSSSSSDEGRRQSHKHLHSHPHSHVHSTSSTSRDRSSMDVSSDFFRRGGTPPDNGEVSALSSSNDDPSNKSDALSSSNSSSGGSTGDNECKNKKASSATKPHGSTKMNEGKQKTTVHYTHHHGHHKPKVSSTMAMTSSSSSGGSIAMHPRKQAPGQSMKTASTAGSLKKKKKTKAVRKQASTSPMIPVSGRSISSVRTSASTAPSFAEEPIPPNETKEAKKRRMNRITAKKKRARQKIEIEVLNEQAHELSSLNQTLKAENDHLTKTMEMVTKLVAESGIEPLEPGSEAALAARANAEALFESMKSPPQISAPPASSASTVPTGHANVRALSVPFLGQSALSVASSGGNDTRSSSVGRSMNVRNVNGRKQNSSSLQQQGSSGQGLTQEQQQLLGAILSQANVNGSEGLQQLLSGSGGGDLAQQLQQLLQGSGGGRNVASQLQQQRHQPQQQGVMAPPPNPSFPQAQTHNVHFDFQVPQQQQQLPLQQPQQINIQQPQQQQLNVSQQQLFQQQQLLRQQLEQQQKRQEDQQQNSSRSLVHLANQLQHSLQSGHLTVDQAQQLLVAAANTQVPNQSQSSFNQDRSQQQHHQVTGSGSFLNEGQQGLSGGGGIIAIGNSNSLTSQAQNLLTANNQLAQQAQQLLLSGAINNGNNNANNGNDAGNESSLSRCAQSLADQIVRAAGATNVAQLLQQLGQPSQQHQ